MASPEHAKTPFLPRSRLEMLSDLIFGLSLALSALTLAGAQSYTPASIANRIIAFIFNFAIIMIIWVRYTGTMAILPVETGQVIFLNIVMLLLVSLSSYLLSIIQFSLFVPDSSLNSTDNMTIGGYASTLYAIVLAGLVGIQGFFTHFLSREEMGFVPQSQLHNYRAARNAQFLIAILFLISALPMFWDPNFLPLGLPLRIQVWWIPLFGSIFLLVGKYGLGARGGQHYSSQ